MNSENLFNCFKSLIEKVSQFIPIDRSFNPQIRQCSVITLFKFSNSYLKKNPQFTSALKKILNLNQKSSSFNHPEALTQLISLIKSQISKIQKSTETDTKIKGDNILKILFSQRIVNPRDRHSGQICFPGGNLDKGESDLEGGIRELEEEIGIKISPKNSIHLGKLPINYYAYVKKNFKYKISPNYILSLENLDFLDDYENCPLNEKNFLLSQTEIQDAWWVDYNFFFREHKPDVLIKIVKDDLDYNISSFGVGETFKKNIPKNIQEKISKSKFTFVFYMIKFPNQKILWGLTLLFTGCMIELSLFEGIGAENEKIIHGNAMRSRRYLATCGDLEVDYYVSYGMRCREEILRMGRYFGPRLGRMRL